MARRGGSKVRLMARDQREERRRDEQQASCKPSLGPREARALFEAVSDHRVRRWRFFDDALAPAMPTWSGFAREYVRYRRFASAPPFARGGDSPWEDLWTFYALSRVFEWLIIGIQDRADLGCLDANWPREGDHPVLSRDEMVRFFGAFGMEPMRIQPCYHPFYHEVAAELDLMLGDTVLVEEEVWPGLWFGDLVFARADVRVRCGPDAPFDPALAARSILYFAWTRVHRGSCDLSHGWGSGSQWGTAFRRDYADGAVLHYNVDGCVRLTDDAIIPPRPAHERGDDADLCGDLTPAERVELLTHRCFVRTAKPDKDRWPFDDTYTGPAPGPDWTW